MPLNFNKPVTSGNYSTDVLQPLVDAQKALAQWLDPAVAGTLTGTPTGAYRLNTGAVERYNGTSWAAQSINGLSFAGGVPSFAAPLSIGSTTVDKLTLTYTGFGVGSIGVDAAGSVIIKADEASTQGSTVIKLRVDGSDRVVVDALKTLIKHTLQVGANSTIDVLEDTGRGKLVLYEGAPRTKGLVILNASGYGQLLMTSAEDLRLGTSNVDRVILDASGHLFPNVSGAQNWGTASKRWSTGYVVDMSISGKATAGVYLGTKQAVAASSIDVSTGNVFTKTISGVTTFTVANVPASGVLCCFVLDLINGGSSAITWWAGVKWPGGAAPSFTASGRDVVGFLTHDGGTTWTGVLLGRDVK